MKIDTLQLGCYAGWRRYEGNPVIGPKIGECFDVSVLEDEGVFKMYFSWRSQASIALSESRDGLAWSDPVVVLSPDRESGWENDVNRISVIKKDGLYWMWYCGQVSGTVINEEHELLVDDSAAFSWIGLATSEDGVHFTRRPEPVMKPVQPWEKNAIMCPHVIFDEDRQVFCMWYSGGGWFEPDAIGYAESPDGIHWTPDAANPVFSAVKENLWERDKVTACQVLKDGDWYYMFYIGFEDIDKARICCARSRDGIHGWERHPQNPILTGGRAASWDCEAVYKPFVYYDREKDEWIMWYNGRRAYVEQIGVALHKGHDLGFGT